MRRALPILLLLFLPAALRAEGPALTPMASLTVDSSEVRYDYGAGAQTVHTGAPTTIRGEVSGLPSARVLIKTGEAEADLLAGRIQAGPEVEFIAPGAYLTGGKLTLEMSPRRFELERAQAVVDLAPPGRPPVLAQFHGDVMGGNDKLIWVDHGYLAPSTDPEPDVYVSARRIAFDRATGKLKAYNGTLHFYGVKIPMLPVMRKRLVYKRGIPDLDDRIIPALRYGTADGFNIPYFWDFSADESDTSTTLGISVTQKRGITFLTQSRRETPSFTLSVAASRMEDVRDRLRGHLVRDRLPELFAEKFQYHREQDEGWRVAVNAGNFLERDSDPGAPPEVHRQRYLVGAGYEWGSDQYAKNVGRWAQVWTTQAFYSEGEQYTDAAVTAGAGSWLTPRFQGALTLVHHFLAGRTPFQFDQADIQTEARPLIDWQVTRDWRAHAEGRWDLDAGRLRDYKLALGKRMLLLTWTLTYQFIGAVVGVRVDINGVTGGTTAPPLISPLAQQYLDAQAELNQTSP